MNLQNITEQELLDLMGKTEEEQYKYLGGLYLFSDSGDWCGLADLSVRLWEKALPIGVGKCICLVCEHVVGKKWYHTACYCWWAQYAPSHPIAVIVAALIAIKRSGGEL
jgi:hypothetical protein